MQYVVEQMHLEEVHGFELIDEAVDSQEIKAIEGESIKAMQRLGVIEKVAVAFAVCGLLDWGMANLHVVDILRSLII